MQQQSRVCGAVVGFSDDQPLERDFTYVGDIVNGTLAALFYEPRGCGEVFNLGFGSPIRLLGMIDIMQQELGIAGKVVRYFFRFEAFLQGSLLCQRVKQTLLD